jgi:hypothetical protein
MDPLFVCLPGLIMAGRACRHVHMYVRQGEGGIPFALEEIAVGRMRMGLVIDEGPPQAPEKHRRSKRATVSVYRGTVCGPESHPPAFKVPAGALVPLGHVWSLTERVCPTGMVDLSALFMTWGPEEPPACR